MFSYHPIEKAGLKDEHGIKSYTKVFFEYVNYLVIPISRLYLT